MVCYSTLAMALGKSYHCTLETGKLVDIFDQAHLGLEE